MAKYTRNEFCELTNIKSGYLSVYIQRGKIIEKNGLFDDKVPENRDFITKRSRHTNVKKVPVQVQESPKKQKIKQDNTEQVELDLKTPQGTNYELDAKKKLLQIEQMEADLEEQRRKRERRNGMWLPTDMVKNVFAQHSKSLVTSFRSGCENLIISVSKKGKFTREQKAKIHSELIEILNTCSEAAVAETLSVLHDVILETMNKKEPGEKE